MKRIQKPYTLWFFWTSCLILELFQLRAASPFAGLPKLGSLNKDTRPIKIPSIFIAGE